MEPDRQVVFFYAALEDREELGIIERPAVDVGEDLDAFRAELADRIVHFRDGRGHVVQRQRGDERRKIFRMRRLSLGCRNDDHEMPHQIR